MNVAVLEWALGLLDMKTDDLVMGSRGEFAAASLALFLDKRELYPWRWDNWWSAWTETETERTEYAAAFAALHAEVVKRGMLSYEVPGDDDDGTVDEEASGTGEQIEFAGVGRRQGHHRAQPIPLPSG